MLSPAAFRKGEGDKSQAVFNEICETTKTPAERTNKHCIISQCPQAWPDEIAWFLQGAKQDVMALRTHHSIVDAWSLQVLLADLGSAYQSALAGEQPELPALEVQYSDFAAWQHKQLESGGWQEHVDFWKTQLAGANEVLDLPPVHPRPEDSSGEGYFVPLTISPALRQKLEAVATEARASPLMLLTAVFQVCSPSIPQPPFCLILQALRYRIALQLLPGIAAK